VGVSFDSVSSLAEFASEESFLYDLWSDDDKTLAIYYGAAASTSTWAPDRLTVLLDGDGNQLLEYEVGFGFGTHPSEVLEDCEAIFGD
jgi:peroxiredoxin